MSVAGRPLDTWYGMSSTELRAGELRVVVIPELGGKIGSLRFGDHEWLAPPAGDLRRPAYETLRAGRYVRLGRDAAHHRRVRPAFRGGAPDHGEVWSQAWRIERASREELVCEVSGRVLPYALRRRMSVASGDRMGTLRLDYELRDRPRARAVAVGGASQFRVSPKTRLVFPSHVDGVWQVWPLGTRLFWPTGGQPALDGVPEGEARSSTCPPGCGPPGAPSRSPTARRCG